LNKYSLFIFILSVDRQDCGEVILAANSCIEADPISMVQPSTSY